MRKGVAIYGLAVVIGIGIALVMANAADQRHMASQAGVASGCGGGSCGGGGCSMKHASQPGPHAGCPMSAAIAEAATSGKLSADKPEAKACDGDCKDCTCPNGKCDGDCKDCTCPDGRCDGDCKDCTCPDGKHAAKGNANAGQCKDSCDKGPACDNACPKAKSGDPSAPTT
jgi:hypothetical protein